MRTKVGAAAASALIAGLSLVAPVAVAQHRSPAAVSARMVVPAPERAPAAAAIKVAQADGRRRSRRTNQAKTPRNELLAVIDLSSQRIRVHDVSGEVMNAPVSSGMAGHRTPQGIFSVLQKRRWHESNIYSGAPMPFMQRLTWSGIALHAGSLPGYAASHGCIRLPSGFASRLFSSSRMGMRVVVTPSRTSVHRISHPALPTPLMVAAPLDPADPAVGPGASAPRTRAGQAVGVRVATADTPTSDGPQPGAGLAPVATRFLNPAERARARRDKAKVDAAAAAKAAKEALILARQAAEESEEADDGIEEALEAVTAAKARLAKAVANEADADDTAKAEAAQARVDAAIRVADMERAWKEAQGLATALRPMSFQMAVKSREADDARDTAAANASLANRALSPIAVLISRKTGKLHMRQGYMPMFEAPVTFKSADRPIGTHLFMAMDADDSSGQVAWMSVTVPERVASLRNRKPVRRGYPADDDGPASSAREALERIEMAPEVRRQLADRLWIGASIVITDHGVSNETGKYTDFIVLTR